MRAGGYLSWALLFRKLFFNISLALRRSPVAGKAFTAKSQRLDCTRRLQVSGQRIETQLLYGAHISQEKVAVDLASVKQDIAKTGKNFVALSPLPALKVNVRFVGKLDDKEVLWDATIQTLASHLAESEVVQSTKQSPAKLHSFMRVEEPHNNVSALKIVLAVPLIDEPTIKKTIIMIRCYKRLKVGYHEFGKNL